MSLHILATLSAFTMQTLGGVVLAMVAGQAVTGSPVDGDAIPYVAAIGALFSLVTWLAKGRIERCEKREDKMLDADSDKTTTLRELGAAVGKAADITGGAVTAATGAIEESRRNGVKLDALTAAVTELSRNVERLSENRGGR